MVALKKDILIISHLRKSPPIFPRYMLQSILRFLVGAACIWVFLDSLFGFENSWILFLARVFSPFLVAVSVATFVIVCIWRYFILKKYRSLFDWRYILVILACAAPTLRSLIVNSTHPTSATDIPSQHPPLRLLNANILGFIDLSASLVREVRQRNPDIVTLQEVNPVLAQALHTELGARYPCQILDSIPGSRGMGVLSKFPCTSLPVSHAGNWVGRPQLLAIEIAPGKKVLVANIHAIHPHAFLQPDPRDGPTPPASLSDTISARERAIEEVINAAKTAGETAVIISGDLNATMRNSVYQKIRSAGYHDSWLRQHSFAGGGTWPSPDYLGIQLLGWLLRIDFVHSSTLRVRSSEVLPASLGSDHRGLAVEFEVL
jgi:endonuclease/exonuclease/phosphatase (EEP) superfamily protein YafD